MEQQNVDQELGGSPMTFSPEVEQSFELGRHLGPPNYQEMTLEELAEWAGRRANQYRQIEFHCSESVLRAASEALGIKLSDEMLRTSTGFRGGGGGYGDRCGALNSGAMLISYLYGRVLPTEDNTCPSELTYALHERFEEQLGGTKCSVLMNVYFKLSTDDSCEIVYAAGARLAVQLLGEASQICALCPPVPRLAALKASQVVAAD